MLHVYTIILQKKGNAVQNRMTYPSLTSSEKKFLLWYIVIIIGIGNLFVISYFTKIVSQEILNFVGGFLLLGFSVMKLYICLTFSVFKVKPHSYLRIYLLSFTALPTFLLSVAILIGGQYIEYFVFGVIFILLSGFPYLIWMHSKYRTFSKSRSNALK